VAAGQPRLGTARPVEPSASVGAGDEAAGAGSTSFVSNMKLPVHRWYRYSAGYSATWARDEIVAAKGRFPQGVRVLDPFAGSGTTLLAADEAGVPSFGFEAQPFAFRVCEAKLAWDAPAEPFSRHLGSVLQAAKADVQPVASTPLLDKCFAPEVARQLQSLARAVDAEQTDEPTRRLLWLALVAIIRRCSHAGTAPWQYVLPAKTKAKVVTQVFAEYEAQARTMLQDMRTFAAAGAKRGSAVLPFDARSVPEGHGVHDINLVVTSPPYANNYDYGDATRLELTLLGDVAGWGDLKRYRERLVVSCSQHAAYLDQKARHLLGKPLLAPIRADLEAACGELGKLRETRGGKKQYDDMVASYFHGMAEHWRELRGLLAPGAELCYVVGDSAPYGVPIPTDEWLTRLAEPFGFAFDRFDKVRDRNVKWKNRKHRVPLNEGCLWLTFQP
jgi:hypothetical protein